MLKLSFDTAAVTLSDRPPEDESLADLLLATDGEIESSQESRRALERAFQVPGVSQYVEEFMLEDYPDTSTAQKFIRLCVGNLCVVLLFGDRIAQELEFRIYMSRGEFWAALPNLASAYPDCHQMCIDVLETKK